MINNSQEYKEYEKARNKLIKEAQKLRPSGGVVIAGSETTSEEKAFTELEKKYTRYTSITITYAEPNGSVTETVVNNKPMGIMDCLIKEEALRKELTDQRIEKLTRWFESQGCAFGINLDNPAAFIIQIDRPDLTMKENGDQA